MSNTYTWTTTSLLTQTVGNETDYVVIVNYDVLGINDTDNQYHCSLYFTQELTVIYDQPDYIPYNELTNEIVIGWVQETLGTYGIESIYISIDGNIESQINPPISPVNTPLPF